MSEAKKEMVTFYWNILVELLLIGAALLSIFNSKFELGILIFILIELRELNYKGK